MFQSIFVKQPYGIRISDHHAEHRRTDQVQLLHFEGLDCVLPQGELRGNIASLVQGGTHEMSLGSAVFSI